MVVVLYSMLSRQSVTEPEGSESLQEDALEEEERTRLEEDGNACDEDEDVDEETWDDEGVDEEAWDDEFREEETGEDDPCADEDWAEDTWADDAWAELSG
jgi:hypothetical protein